MALDKDGNCFFFFFCPLIPWRVRVPCSILISASAEVPWASSSEHTDTLPAESHPVHSNSGTELVSVGKLSTWTAGMWRMYKACRGMDGNVRVLILCWRSTNIQLKTDHSTPKKDGQTTDLSTRESLILTRGIIVQQPYIRAADGPAAANASTDMLRPCLHRECLHHLNVQNI